MKIEPDSDERGEGRRPMQDRDPEQALRIVLRDPALRSILGRLLLQKARRALPCELLLRLEESLTMTGASESEDDSQSGSTFTSDHRQWMDLLREIEEDLRAEMGPAETERKTYASQPILRLLVLTETNGFKDVLDQLKEDPTSEVRPTETRRKTSRGHRELTLPGPPRVSER